MAARVNKPERPLLKAALISAISAVVLMEAPPLYLASYDVIEVAAFGGLIIGAPPLVARGLLMLANAIDTLEARLPRDTKDMAQFAKSLKDFKGSLERWKPAPYWGAIGGKAIFADFQANALCLGPAGTSKDVSNAGPNIFAIKESKVILDMKSDMMVIYAKALRERGEIVHCLNYGDLYKDRINDEAFYNPLNLISDCFAEGSINDVTADVAEMALQIYPEPKSDGEGGNRFFRNGSRKLISFCIIICVIIHGETATLGHVLQMLQDKESLLHHALWAAGRLEQADGLAKIPLHESPWAKDGSQSFEDIESFADYLAGLGASTSDLVQAQDSRTFDSFIEGAMGEMADFNVTTRAHKKMKISTFRFSNLKKKGVTTTVFIGGDASRVDANKKIIEITTANMFKELMRAENISKPVYVFGNEITNFKIANLEKYLTFLRSYKVKLILYVQSLAAFRETYGKNATSTLLSETEIKYVLAGQRDPETLKMLEELLGNTKTVKRTNTGNRRDGADGLSGLDSFTYTEEAKPLLTADQIRRLDKGILFLGKHKPALIDTPSIASIWPFRKWQEISPFYSKPYLERIKLRLWRYAPFSSFKAISTLIRKLKS